MGGRAEAAVVDTLTVALPLTPLLSESEVGETVQLASEGAPLQVSASVAE